jgi:hypothetical protein
MKHQTRKEALLVAGWSSRGGERKRASDVIEKSSQFWRRSSTRPPLPVLQHPGPRA